MSKLKRLLDNPLVRNTAWMILGHGSRIGFYGTYFVLAARWLGAEGLGVFAGALALVKILQPFAAVGSDQILARRVSRDRDEYAPALGDALIITLTTGTVFTLIAVLINEWMFAGKVSWQLTLLIACAELIFYRLQLLVRRTFQAVDRLSITAVVKAAPGPALLLAIGGFKLTSETASVDVWAYWYFVAMVIPSVVALGYTLVVLGRPRFAWASAFRQLSEGFFFSLSESTKVIYTDADKILLLRLVSREAAGVYKAAYRIVSVLMVPVLALIDATYARFFRTGATGLRGSYGFAVKLLPISLLYSGLVAIGIYIAAPLLPLLLGESYASSVDVLRWIAPIPVVQGASYMLLQTLTGGGFQRARSIAEALVAVFAVTVNYHFIPLHSWRAAAGTAVASEVLILLSSFCLCHWLSRRDARQSEA